MNEWDQRIREHRIWDEMQKLGPIIDEAAVAKELAPETVVGLQRIKALLTYCGKRIAAAEPLISSPAPLDAIAVGLSAVQNELTAFINDKNPVHIATANATMDGILPALSQVPGIYSPEELGALVSTVGGYRNLVSEALTDAQERLKGGLNKYF